MADPAKRRATYEDLLAVPDRLVAEILHGNLVTHPRPALRHGKAATSLGALVFVRARTRRAGRVALPRRTRAASSSGHRCSRPRWVETRASARASRRGLLRASPGLGCEVLSPSTVATDRVDKLPIYAREGVRNVWFVDPLARTLEVLRLERGAYWLVGQWRDDAVVRAEPFDAIEIELAVLWSR